MYVQVKITSQFYDVIFVFDNILEFTGLFAITEKERDLKSILEQLYIFLTANDQNI